MYGRSMFGYGLPQPQAQTIFGAYAQTADALNTIRQNQIKNALSQIDLNAAPQLMKENLAQQAAKTFTMQNTANYAPILSALDVQKQRIANAMNSEKFKEMPQAFQQGMALKAAQIEQIKQNIQLAPQKLALSQNRQQFYSSPEYNIPKAVGLQKGAARDAFLANNQQAIDAYTSNILRGALAASQQPQGMQGGQMPPPGSGIVPMGASLQPQPQPQMQQGGAIPAPVIPTQTTQFPVAAPSSNSVMQQQLANQIASNKQSVSPYITKKLDNTIQIDKFLNSPAIDLLVQSASEYTGIKGKGKEFIDRWKSENSEKFENNYQFRNSFTSDIVNLQKNLEQLSIQPSQRAELIANFRKAFDEWSSNPERAQDQFYRTIAQLKDIAGANSIAAQPLYPGVREHLAGLPPPSTNHLYNYINQSRAANQGIVKMIGEDGKTYSVPVDKVHDATTNFKMRLK
jgi:hypothetical protein